MDNLTNYYIQVDLYENQNIEIIKENKKRFQNDVIFSKVYNHLLTIIPENTTIEILHNLNYQSIIWEFLRAYDINSTNANFQHFKSMLLYNISPKDLQTTSKLNAMHLFNSYIYKLIKA